MGRQQVQKVFYYIAFVLIIFSDFTSRTMFVEKIHFFSELNKLLLYFSCIILVIKFFFSKFTKKELIIAGVLIFVACMIVYNTQAYYVIFPIVLLLINSKDISISQLLKVWIFEIIILMSLVAICYKLDIIGETTRISIRRDGSFRFGLGYKYASFSSNYFFHLTLFYTFLKQKKIKILEIFSLLGVNIYLYTRTDTKSAAIFSVLILLLVCFLKWFKIEKENKFINRYIMLIGLSISLGTVYLYNVGSGISYYLNIALTGRLQLASMAWYKYGITLFGQKISWITQSQWLSELRYDYVDSSFLNILFNYGIVILISIVLGFYLLSFHRIAKSSYYTAMLLILTLHCIYDPQLLEISHNPSILFLGYVIFERKNNLDSDFLSGSSKIKEY